MQFLNTVVLLQFIFFTIVTPQDTIDCIIHGKNSKGKSMYIDVAALARPYDTFLFSHIFVVVIIQQKIQYILGLLIKLIFVKLTLSVAHEKSPHV